MKTFMVTLVVAFFFASMASANTFKTPFQGLIFVVYEKCNPATDCGAIVLRKDFPDAAMCKEHTEGAVLELTEVYVGARVEGHCIPKGSRAT